MKTQKVIIHKATQDFVNSLDGQIEFNKHSEQLRSFLISEENFAALFQKTIKTGNNPFELYSWEKNLLPYL